MKRAVTLYFNLHQPWCLRPYCVVDMAVRHDYIDAARSQQLFHQQATCSYLPMTELLLQLCQHQAEFALSLHLSGPFLEQAQQFCPPLIAMLQQLVATGRVELVASPYYYGASFFYNQSEFTAQIQRHQHTIEQLFRVKMHVVAHTGLAYSDQLGQWAESAGFIGVLAEADDALLEWRSPGYVYQPPATSYTRLLLSNHRLSNDIAQRFSDRQWSEWPLTAATFERWVYDTAADGPLVNLCMNYDTFGGRHRAADGIFEFFSQFVQRWARRSDTTFYTVSQALAAQAPVGQLASSPAADASTSQSEEAGAMQGVNELQREALRYLRQLAPLVAQSGDSTLLEAWRQLQAADYIAAMSATSPRGALDTVRSDDGTSPPHAFLSYMNILRDIHWRLMRPGK